jgi:hypothetical protein
VTDATKLMAGLLLITVTTIEYGGTFLLGLLSGKQPEFTDFQRSMFRAGHAHAGVLVILALVSLLFIEQTKLSTPMAWVVRIGFVAAPILVSAGFSLRRWERAELGQADSSHYCGLVSLYWAEVSSAWELP